MIKRLRPIVVKESHVRAVSGEIERAMYHAIFLPIFEILGSRPAKRINSISDIKAALRSGRIFWQEGWFYGQFNAAVGIALRGLGAKFSSSKKGYKLDIDKIPMDVRTDIAIGKGVNRAKTEAILRALDQASQMKMIVGDGDAAVSILADLNKQSIETMRILPENLQIPLQLSERQQQSITESYTANMNLYIKDWQQEAIERLREKTQANAALGYRADRLAKIVKSEYGVTQSKAKFLARQETSLFVSKYREQRYTSSGVRQYQWSTSVDERVRPDHAKLQGRVFSWSDPPVTDSATGQKNHPGEDFGCRCVAIPIVNLKEI